MSQEQLVVGRLIENLSGTNVGCASVSDFWVLVFGVIRGASTSSRDGVTFVDNVGDVKMSSGG